MLAFNITFNVIVGIVLVNTERMPQEKLVILNVKMPPVICVEVVGIIMFT